MKYVDIDGKELRNDNYDRNRWLAIFEIGCTAYMIVLVIACGGLVTALLFAR